MTSRRSFLRGLLALPAAPLVAPVLPATTAGGPMPGYGYGPLCLSYLEPIDTGHTGEGVMRYIITVDGRELCRTIVGAGPQRRMPFNL